MRILADITRASRVRARPHPVTVTVTASYPIVVNNDSVLIDRLPCEGDAVRTVESARTVESRPVSLPN